MTLNCLWGLEVKLLGPGISLSLASLIDPQAPGLPSQEGRPQERPCVLGCSCQGNGEGDEGSGPAVPAGTASGGPSERSVTPQGRLCYLLRSAQSMALRTRDAHLQDPLLFL